MQKEAGDRYQEAGHFPAHSRGRRPIAAIRVRLGSRKRELLPGQLGHGLRLHQIPDGARRQ